MSAITSINSSYSNAVAALSKRKAAEPELQTNQKHEAGPSSIVTLKSQGGNDPASSPGILLTPATLSDMYNSNVMAAIDANSDGTISKDEYSAQIVAAGGTQASANALFSKLDKDNDGTISSKEFASTAKLPFEGNSLVQKISQITKEIMGGQSTDAVSGNVLNADGTVNANASDHVLRHLVELFPGNVADALSYDKNQESAKSELKT